MKTDELIGMLANGDVGVRAHTVERRLVYGLCLGAVGSVILMLGLIGVRPDLAEASTLPMFWVKLGFSASLAASGLYASLRLARPGAGLRAVPVALGVPVLAIWLLAAIALATVAPGDRLALSLGDSWQDCPLLIGMLSVPVFVGVLWAMAGLGPTRLRLAGAAGGLLAGAIASSVYCLHCPEMAAPFIACWYLLGILIPTGLGALVGPRLLRW